jgi:uncharacterized repeat protein (TIGR03803 family)
MKKLVLFLVLCYSLLTPCKGQYTDLMDFNYTNGSRPNGSVCFSGDKLYAMTWQGGFYSLGCIFSYNTVTMVYADLFDFNDSTGNLPDASLTLSGNVLYGMTSSGGSHNDGTIFSINKDGSNFNKLLDFNGKNGKNPNGSLTLSNNGILYGMTMEGGTSNYGVIFSIHTDGNGYKDLLNFNLTNGFEPAGDLTLYNGSLYGMTWGGGEYDAGNIFSIDTNGSGYKDLHDFAITDGENPHGSLILSGNNLYGMTYSGGTTNGGTIFSINTSGADFSTLYSFNDSISEPVGNLTLSGSVLYGYTQGGLFSGGLLFSFNMNSKKNKFIDLFDFYLQGGYGMGDGSYLTLYDNTLYGLTSNGGGLDNVGTLFSFNLGPEGINKLSVDSSQLSVFPNPNKGKFTIQIANSHLLIANSQIEVFNALGENIYSKSYPPFTNSYQLDLSSNPSGVYFYKVISESGSFLGSGKIIIENDNPN